MRADVVYSGRVQGVGFRYRTLLLAADFAVHGWVRNLPDGRVELVAAGERDAVERFLDAVRDEMGTLVRAADVTWSSSTVGVEGFHILR